MIIFYLPSIELSTTNAIKHEIIVTDTTPITCKIYRYPEVNKGEGEKKLYIVRDYRKLNNVTIGDCYPLPNIHFGSIRSLSILRITGYGRWFSLNRDNIRYS